MKAWSRIISGVLVLLLLLSNGKGQGLRINFDRQNNFTYSVRTFLDHTYQSDSYRMEASLSQDMIINTNRNPSSLVLLNVRGMLWQYWKLGRSWEALSLTEIEQFWTTQNQRYSQYAGLTYRWKEVLEVSPMLGYSWDYRSERLDQGISPALRLRSRYRFEDGTEVENFLWSRLKYIAPRHQRNISFRSHWNKKIAKQAEIAWGAEAGSNQMDDYRLSSIEQIQSDTLAAFLSLRYFIRPRLSWTSDNRLVFNRRILDFEAFEEQLPDFNDLRFNQTQLFSLQQLDYVRDKWTVQGQYQFEFLERLYQLENNLDLPLREFDRLLAREKQKDAFRRTHSFQTNLSYAPVKKHKISLEASNKYIQYDTPSENNFDDHDELNYSLRMGWNARWNPSFSTNYSLTGTYRQYAFLFAERSQDNYTQRNLRLDFSYIWIPLERLRLSGEQRIYVTYNVKDFLDRNLTDRSTRNLESSLGATFRHNKKTRSYLQFYRKEIQVSYLNWLAFSETTLDTLITYRLEWRTNYSQKFAGKAYRMLWEGGFKYAGRFRKLNSSMTSLENILTPINLHIRTQQTGPTTGFKFFSRRGQLLELNVWWQWQIQDFVYREMEDFVTLSANFQESQLQKIDLSFRPFVRLRLNIWLDK